MPFTDRISVSGRPPQRSVPTERQAEHAAAHQHPHGRHADQPADPERAPHRLRFMVRPISVSSITMVSSRAPLLGIGVGAEHHQAELLDDEAPAGTLGGAAGVRIGLKTASVTAQANSFGSSQSINASSTSVRIELSQELNRRARAKSRTRGASGVRREHVYRSTSCRRLLYQFIKAAVVEAERQVDEHDDRDAFDGLAGLVHGGAGDADEIGIADGHRQRAVLGQVEVLAGERRYDDAQGLRQRDVAQDHAFLEPERARRLDLPLRHGQDAGAYDLADEGRGVDGQAEQHGDEFGRQVAAADEIEAAQFRHAHLGRCAVQKPGGRRQADDQDQVRPQGRQPLAGLQLPRRGPTAEQPDQEQRDGEGDGGREPADVRLREREIHAALREDRCRGSVSACRGLGRNRSLIMIVYQRMICSSTGMLRSRWM